MQQSGNNNTSHYFDNNSMDKSDIKYCQNVQQYSDPIKSSHPAVNIVNIESFQKNLQEEDQTKVNNKQNIVEISLSEINSDTIKKSNRKKIQKCKDIAKSKQQLSQVIQLQQRQQDISQQLNSKEIKNSITPEQSLSQGNSEVLKRQKEELVHTNQEQDTIKTIESDISNIYDQDQNFSIQVEFQGNLIDQKDINFEYNNVKSIDQQQNYIPIKENDIIIPIRQKLNERNYFITHFVAKGGEGKVYLGYQIDDKNEKKPYIFKIYEDCDQTIEEEIRIMNVFENRYNVVYLKEYLKITENIYVFIMKKCEYSLKEELTSFEKQHKKFKKRKLIQMFLDLLDGLIQFRMYNILHLDIKPDNILVNINTDDSYNYQYTDFGISSFYSDKQPICSKGYTQMYAPDEQKKNKSNISFYSDVYSLGKTFKQILKVFRQVRFNYQKSCFVDELFKIVEENMTKEEVQERMDCLQLHEKFFSEIKKQCKPSFLIEYSIKLNQIANLFTYDSNKDTKYFLELKLHYNQLALQLFRFQKSHLELKYYNSSICKLYSQIGICYQNLGHNQNYLKHLKIAVKLSQKNQEPDEKVALYQNHLGQAYQLNGDYINAIKYLLKSLQLYEKLYPSNSLFISQSKNDIGNCYLCAKDNDIAFQYLQESFENRIEILTGKVEKIVLNSAEKLHDTINHEDIAESLNNLSFFYYRQGDVEKSLINLQQSHDMYQTIFQGNHPQIAFCLINKGLIYQAQNKYSQALKCLEQGLQIRQQIYQQNHPEIAQSLTIIGLFYKDYNDDRALKYLTQSLKLKQQFYKSGIHTDIAANLQLIGIYYGTIENFKEALKYFKYALEMAYKLHQHNHFEIAISLNNVGVCCIEIGDIKQAIQYELEALQVVKQLKQRNPDLIIQAFSNVVECYKKSGEPEKALNYQLESHKMVSLFYSQNSKEYAKSLNKLGECYQDNGDTLTALNLHKQCLEITNQLLQGDDQLIASTLYNIAICQTEMNIRENTKEYLKKVLNLKRTFSKGFHPGIIDSLNNLGIYYKEKNKNEKALAYLLESLNYGKDQKSRQYQPSISTTLSELGLVYKQSKNKKLALQYSMESLNKRKEIYKDQFHPDTAASLNNVGLCYQDASDHKNALIYLYKSLEMLYQMYPNQNHPQVAVTLNNIGMSYKQLKQFEFAFQYLKDSLEMTKQIYQGNHEDVASSYVNIADYYTDLGQIRQAIDSYEIALVMINNIFQNNYHPLKHIIQTNLQYCYQNL